MNKEEPLPDKIRHTIFGPPRKVTRRATFENRADNAEYVVPFLGQVITVSSWGGEAGEGTVGIRHGNARTVCAILKRWTSFGGSTLR